MRRYRLCSGARAIDGNYPRYDLFGKSALEITLQDDFIVRELGDVLRGIREQLVHHEFANPASLERAPVELDDDAVVLSIELSAVQMRGRRNSSRRAAHPPP
jgi:hypothetical protein